MPDNNHKPVNKAAAAAEEKDNTTCISSNRKGHDGSSKVAIITSGCIGDSKKVPHKKLYHDGYGGYSDIAIGAGGGGFDGAPDTKEHPAMSRPLHPDFKSE